MNPIDTPDFDQALASSRDGSFQRAVLAALERAHADVQAQLQRGLSPLEFEQASRVEAALVTAGHVVRFSSAT